MTSESGLYAVHAEIAPSNNGVTNTGSIPVIIQKPARTNMGISLKVQGRVSDFSFLNGANQEKLYCTFLQKWLMQEFQS